MISRDQLLLEALRSYKLRLTTYMEVQENQPAWLKSPIDVSQFVRERIDQVDEAIRDFQEKLVAERVEQSFAPPASEPAPKRRKKTQTAGDYGT